MITEYRDVHHAYENLTITRKIIHWFFASRIFYFHRPSNFRFLLLLFSCFVTRDLIEQIIQKCALPLFQILLKLPIDRYFYFFLIEWNPISGGFPIAWNAYNRSLKLKKKEAVEWRKRNQNTKKMSAYNLFIVGSHLLKSHNWTSPMFYSYQPSYCWCIILLVVES